MAKKDNNEIAFPVEGGNAEKLKALQAKCERLEVKLHRLLNGEPVRKVHFNLDGERTACGISLFDHDLDYSDNINEVTCNNCKKKWQALKNKWERELKAEQKQNERY